MKSRILADAPAIPDEFAPTSQATGRSRLLDTTPKISPVFKNSTSAYLSPLTKQIATPPSADATRRVGGISSTKSCSSIADAHAIAPSEGFSAPSGQRDGSFLIASNFAKWLSNSRAAYAFVAALVSRGEAKRSRRRGCA